MSRFIVTELEGYIQAREGPGPMGISCHVVDTMWNHRLVATYRTEDRPYKGRWGVRIKAREHADRLNARC